MRMKEKRKCSTKTETQDVVEETNVCNALLCFIFASADGVHAVSAQCLLQVTIITDEMLSNSITLRLANTSQEQFLSLLLAQFLDGVARVLSASRQDVVVFNIQDDTDVSARILNVSLSVPCPSSPRPTSGPAGSATGASGPGEGWRARAGISLARRSSRRGCT